MIAAICFDPLPLFLAVRSDPSLARTPLVSAEEQRVTHANASARRHGITPGMRLDGARMRVEGLQVVSYAEPDLQHAWEELLRELSQHTPWVESWVRGRAFARLEEAEAEELAAHHGVRVGMAHDCETAELAAVSARPGTARQAYETSGFLSRLPLRFLRGVGLSEGNLTRLTWLGLTVVSHLAGWTASQISSYLADDGEALLPYLHGPRRTTLRPFELPPTVSRSLAFTEPVVEPYRLLPALDRLSGELAKELRGRAARRLTLTASLPGTTRRASRLSKRPLTQARHIRQQALFALHDSHAEGQPIEGLTLELASPERISLQGGLWPQRERRQRALETSMERFPTAQRRLAWEDPHAQATDLVWRWEGYAEEGGAYDSASVAERGAAANLDRKRRRAGKDEARGSGVQAAVTAAAVPLFHGTASDEQAPNANAELPHGQGVHTPQAPAPETVKTPPTYGTGAAASYLDALFTGQERPEEAATVRGMNGGGPVREDRPTTANDKQRGLYPAAKQQRYTEEYGLEAA